ncbi:hypothetical protein [Streptomyces sp. Ncost-T10-10d]|uniref:hypothetical protein n=1 Tax=Streptomyces sp. Ncost-T10-10d TaxID=1839774 RepID=UPI00081F02EB|nr:hypothetical protein [Streptomyces sp. Ncost-T10-10d]SCF69605.1 hypothetical protein GA0115254_111799 [Streptomyces sp. Ncost-T10-10d]
MKKMMAGAAVAVSLAGPSAAVAPAAMAIGNDQRTTSVNGNEIVGEFGNSVSQGDGRPQFQLVQGTPAKGDEALSHLVDDIPVLSGNGVGNS